MSKLYCPCCKVGILSEDLVCLDCGESFTEDNE